MNVRFLKNIIPHLVVFASFIVISLVYFYPVLSGKKLYQSDIAQFTAMGKETIDFRKNNDGEEPYWNNSVFGGMPSYQVNVIYPYAFAKKATRLIRFLPAPAGYIFLYFVGIYILFLVLNIDYKIAFLGALAFGFSTYLIIIIGVGHNAKADAIGYMPLIIAGILLVFKRNYISGFLLTTVAMALEIAANHIQMTYYLLFLVLIIGVVFLIEAFKKRQLWSFFGQIGILTFAVLLALGMNATNLMATSEYAAQSTRGKSELTIDPQGNPRKVTAGLNKDYITQYSYGKLETFNLFIPRFMGGSNHENIGANSNLYKTFKGKVPQDQLEQLVKNAPTYWGKQPIVAAPAYIGAVVLFLFVMGLFLVKGKHKWWLVGGVIFSILLSWGKHMEFLTSFFIDYIPLYSKFRAVSSIQVLAELCVPVLGILALAALLDSKISKQKKQQALKNSLMIFAGILLVFILFGKNMFSFEGLNDSHYGQLLTPLIADRKAMLFSDSLRTLIFVLLTAGSLWLYLKEKINRNVAIAILAVLLIADLVGVDKRYVNADDFVPAKMVDRPFRQSPADKQILADKGIYRVLNLSVSPMNDGSTSYFHKSIGGYHAAKPGRYQELFDHHIAKNNREVINMLNTKYFIIPDKNGKLTVRQNEDANGNAWFVDTYTYVSNADEEIKALKTLRTKNEAVVDIRFKKLLGEPLLKRDSLRHIELITYRPNRVVYKTKNRTEQLAVFSEMYYADGWNAYIDGVQTPLIRVDYVLRALFVPPGQHTITFQFEPAVIQRGNVLTLVSTFVFLGCVLGGFFLKRKCKKSCS